MQVDLIKPTLKSPVTKRLKLMYYKLLSIIFNFAFKFNLRRYTPVPQHLLDMLNAVLAESDPLVRRCRLTLSNPR